MAQGFLARLLLGQNPYRSGKGLPMALRHFSVADPTISEDATVEGDAWAIEAKGAQTVRLFEVPDPDVGERIKSFVVVRQDVKGVGGQELIRWCKDRLAPYEVPQYVEFRDMLPKSKAGKLLRRELRAEEQRKREE